jgi:hypothetical protein
MVAVDRAGQECRDRGEILEPVAEPPYCPPEMMGERRDDDLLRVQGRLAAKAAAHIGRHDPDAVSRRI